MADREARRGRDVEAFEMFRTAAESELASIDSYLARARDRGCPMEEGALSGIAGALDALEGLSEAGAAEWGEAALSLMRSVADGLMEARVPPSAVSAVDQALAASRRFEGYVEALMDVAAAR